ncbi:hypothetical protein Pdw03_4390 [Penicillium digitatum]|uniref:Uncharacterized protein n=1 Tax=Penicillium digitatum TaxID=36651 RepID=A0A7T7BIZ1_PENDI|nr:hypothetical protein Pdw03_4390 [Penicillium digitatum]
MRRVRNHTHQGLHLRKALRVFSLHSQWHTPHHKPWKSWPKFQISQILTKRAIPDSSLFPAHASHIAITS